jgi:signal transduction histidine kinase
MQSSNGKEIVLTKTSLPAIRVGFHNTSINVLRPFPSGENPPSLNEKMSPFMGPHIEIEES